VLDEALLAGWCLRHLDAPLERVVSRSGQVSEVLGVELSGGQQVVVKARPFQPRITGCLRVQAELADAGFPCPRPLTAATRVRDLTITAETSMPGGEPLRSEDAGAQFASLLARLVEAAPEFSSVPDLTPSPPWTGWDHPGRRIWPDIDEHGDDLNEATGPEWLDDAARRVRERLTRTPRPSRIGHGDWESQNIRWTDGTPLVVHDWDSVIAQPETAIVGLAAAVWPREDRPDQLASVAQTADFISSYQHVTGREWDSFEVRDAWAAGLWVRLFDAKQEAAQGGGPQLDRLAIEIEERLDRAALTTGRPGRRS
jgi:Ser/Thr protein kinase RdoA (MazF antagonist)